MTVTKHYCDHCGKEVRNGGALRPVELHPFHWGATTVRHVCAKCLNDIEEYIGTARRGADATALRDLVLRIEAEMERCHRRDGGISQELMDAVYEARAAIGEGAQ